MCIETHSAREAVAARAPIAHAHVSMKNRVFTRSVQKEILLHTRTPRETQELPHEFQSDSTLWGNDQVITDGLHVSDSATENEHVVSPSIGENLKSARSVCHAQISTKFRLGLFSILVVHEKSTCLPSAMYDGELEWHSVAHRSFERDGDVDLVMEIIEAVIGLYGYHDSFISMSV